MANTQSNQRLAEALKSNHYLNQHGCLVTDYHKIHGLRVHASSTSGRSGLGNWNGRRVYWYHNHATQSFTVEAS